MKNINEEEFYRWVNIIKIKAQIDILKLAHLRLSVEGIDKTDDIMVFTVNELEQQLKELEDESKTDIEKT